MESNFAAQQDLPSVARSGEPNMETISRSPRTNPSVRFIDRDPIQHKSKRKPRGDSRDRLLAHLRQDTWQTTSVDECQPLWQVAADYNAAGKEYSKRCKFTHRVFQILTRCRADGCAKKSRHRTLRHISPTLATDYAVSVTAIRQIHARSRVLEKWCGDMGMGCLLMPESVSDRLYVSQWTSMGTRANHATKHAGRLLSLWTGNLTQRTGPILCQGPLSAFSGAQGSCTSCLETNCGLRPCRLGSSSAVLKR